MIRPTRLLIALVAAALPLSVGLVWFREGLWVVAAAYIASVLLLAIIDARSSRLMSRMKVNVQPTGHFYIDEPNEIRFALDGGRLARNLAVDAVIDTDTEIATSAALTITFDEAGKANLEMPIQIARRGQVKIETLWLRWRSGLGLNSHVLRVPLNLAIPALPNIAAVRRAAVTYSRRGALFGLKAQQQQGDGSDFDSLREYAPGMNLRAIHWKHSARHRELVTKEFRIEQNHHIIIALDTGYLMREPLKGVAKLDRAINASLILAYQALAEGDRVGIFAFDATVRLFQAPVAGPRSFPQIQKALSALDYSHEETNFTLGLSALMGQLHRRALIIIFTDYVDTVTAELMIENVQRLSKRHLVMFVALKDVGIEETVGAKPTTLEAAAKAITAADFVRERRIVIERLTRLGVSALDVNPEGFDSAVINNYLKIKRREMI